MSEPVEIRFEFSDKQLEPFFNGAKESTEILNNALAISAVEIRSIIVEKISHGSRSGTTYKRGNIVHQAAGAGEAPKTDTGRLVGSIRHDLGFLTADIGSDLIYAIFQEKGTSRMSAHPFLQPSLDEASPKLNRIFENALHKVMGL